MLLETPYATYMCNCSVSTTLYLSLPPSPLLSDKIVNHDPCRGGAGHWNNLYRFKHLASGRYLAAEVDHDTSFDPTRQKLRGASDMVYHLVVDSEEMEPVYTIFELESTTIQRTDQMVPRYYRSFRKSRPLHEIFYCQHLDLPTVVKYSMTAG